MAARCWEVDRLGRTLELGKCESRALALGGARRRRASRLDLEPEARLLERPDTPRPTSELVDVDAPSSRRASAISPFGANAKFWIGALLDSEAGSLAPRLD